MKKSQMRTILDFNSKLGINTIFIENTDILAYSFIDTIYLNKQLGDECLKINKHEVLHFFAHTKEFIYLKNYLFDKYSKEIVKLKNYYILKYSSVYSREDIKNGIVDEEITIDLINDNFDIRLEDGLKIGDILIKDKIKQLYNKRYLNLIVNKNINGMNLSEWEKIFVVNYYDGIKHKFPNINKIDTIKYDIKKELERLYGLSQTDFEISTQSEELEGYYEGEIKSLEKRGEDTFRIKNNKVYYLEYLAQKFSTNLYEQYKHIMDYFKTTDYPDAFKVVILRETLSKVYKLDNNKKIIKKRKLSSSISEHMILNDITLGIIYNDTSKYNNFSELYFEALAIFNNRITKSSLIDIYNVNTYRMGHWIKVEGKNSNPQKYLENAEKLAALVRDTPWCTKQLASQQLRDGDFYIFLDNGNKPHIAVKMLGDEIDEVRGIKNDSAQEIEDDYRKVAISFLENNKQIKNGDKWLEKEEWNERLIEYYKKIKTNALEMEDIPCLIEDLSRSDYKGNSLENKNKQNIIDGVHLFKDKIAKYYNCTEDEIYVGDVSFEISRRDFYEKALKKANIKVIDCDSCPFVIIFGNVYFRTSKTKVGKLRCVTGNALFDLYEGTDIGNLEYIGGECEFMGSAIEDLGNLSVISGDVNFQYSNIRNLGKLKKVYGNADFSYSKIEEFSELEYIGGNVIFGKNQNELKEIYEVSFVNGRKKESRITWFKKY